MTSQDKPNNALPKILLLTGVVVLVLVLCGFGFMMLSKPKTPVSGNETLVTNVVPVADTAPQEAWVEWEEGQAVSSYKVAGYDIALSSADDDGLKLPIITVTNADGKTITVRGEAVGGTVRARFAVVQMDAASEARQVLFSSFSGGAHCCVVPYLIEPTNAGWRSVSLAAWDGDQIGLPKDVDGDGRKEFVMADQGFLYAFSAYADSYPPIAVYSVIDGKFEDVSKEAKYRPLFVEDLPKMRRECERGGNGPCAGYAATAARAGQLDSAWPIVLANTRTDDWGNPAPCRARGDTSCELDDQAPYPTYAEALQWFLGDRGYTAKVLERRDRPDGPSFSCAAARTAAERMVCGNDDLRQADVEMALAYTRAHALSANRQALRDAQSRFLRERNAVTDPKLMLQTYNERIRMLENL